jgi:fatty acid-binding protein DegV
VQKIAIITDTDSRSLSMGQGYMALAAAEAAEQGATSAEIIPLIEDIRARTRLFAALSTLKYLDGRQVEQYLCDDGYNVEY